MGSFHTASTLETLGLYNCRALDGGHSKSGITIKSNVLRKDFDCSSRCSADFQTHPRAGISRWRLMLVLYVTGAYRC